VPINQFSNRFANVYKLQYYLDLAFTQPPETQGTAKPFVTISKAGFENQKSLEVFQVPLYPLLPL